MITQKRLKEVLQYDPDTGIWTWKKTAGIKRMQAGSVLPSGYRRITVDGKSYYSAKLAHLYMIGTLPDEMDHIDRNPSNDRWDNLRLVTHAKNCQNRGKRLDNASGYPGVVYEKRSGKWKVDIGLNGKRIHIGRFWDLDLAIASKRMAENHHWGMQ